jgi:hypothetical protein
VTARDGSGVALSWPTLPRGEGAHMAIEIFGERVEGVVLALSAMRGAQVV